MAIATAFARVHPSQGPDPSPPLPPPAARRTVACLEGARLAWVAGQAIICLFLASLWLFLWSVPTAEMVRFACGCGCALLTPVYKVAYVAGLAVALVLPFTLLLPRLMARAPAAAAATGLEARKEPALKTSNAPMRVRAMLRDPITHGLLALVAFALLMVIGILILVVGDSTVRGSRRQIMGSVIYYVGELGVHTVDCFVLCPLITVRVWRYWRMGRLVL